MPSKSRIAAIVLTLAGLLGASAPAVAAVSWGAAPAPHHAVVAKDTWTSPVKPAKATWT